MSTSPSASLRPLMSAAPAARVLAVPAGCAHIRVHALRRAQRVRADAACVSGHTPAARLQLANVLMISL